MGGSGARGRGLELLTVLFDARCSMEVGAVARALGVTRSAALRQLRVLEDLAFVTRDGDGRWGLPPGGAMTLPGPLVSRLNLRAAARPVIERLALRTGRTVTLNVPNRDHRLRIDAVGDGLSLPVGEALPLDVGTSGRVILAFLPHAVAAPIVAGSGADIRAELAGIRRRGHLAAVGARLPELASLAAPVFGPAGIAGSIAIVGPAARWDREAMERTASAVRIECASLSAALGSLPALD